METPVDLTIRRPHQRLCEFVSPSPLRGLRNDGGATTLSGHTPTKEPAVKRSTLLVALMMVVAILVPAAVASASDVASDGDASTESLPLAQIWKAEMMAGYFAEDGFDDALDEDGSNDADDPLDLLIGLRTAEPAMGWGVLAKLVAYAVASEMNFGDFLASDFLASAQNEDGGYSMGELRKQYLATHELSDLPYRNFGQMQKDQKLPKPGKADKKVAPGQRKKPQS